MTSKRATAVFQRQLRYFFGKATSDAPSTVPQRKELLVAGNKIFLDNPHWSITKYDEALKIDSKCYSSLVKRAFGYYQIEIFESALADADAALEIQPLNSEAHFVKGLVFIKQEEHTLALDSLYKSLDLTVPADPRYESIEHIIRNCQRKIKGEDVDILAKPEPERIVVHQPAPQSTATDASPSPPIQAPVDENLPPFHDSNFVQTQQEISQKMFSMGDDKFKRRMEELAQIPELQEFQRKILSGQTLTQYDYYKLYNEPSGKFAKFSNKLNQMAQHPDLREFAQKAGQGDWNVAFTALKDNPKAMETYMKYFKDEEEEEVNVLEAK